MSLPLERIRYPREPPLPLRVGSAVVTNPLALGVPVGRGPPSASLLPRTMAGVLAGSNRIACLWVGVVTFFTCTPCPPQPRPNCAMHCFWKELRSRTGAPTHLGSLHPDHRGSPHPDHRGSPLTPHPGLYTEQGKKNISE